MALYNPNHDKDRLYLWLDAADISDGVGQPDNNAKVERWTDKSPNKYVFTAASTGQMPTYLTSQPSNDGASKPSVYFNGTQFLSILSGTLDGAAGSARYGGMSNFPSQIHIFCVASFPAQDNAGNVLYAIPPTNLGWRFMTAASSSGSVQQFVYKDSSNQTRSSTISAANYPFLDASSNPQDGIFEVATSETDPEIINIRNGGGTNNTANNSAIADFEDQYTLSIMGGASSSALKGYVREILIFDGALSADKQDNVQGYLNYKWGINRLPATHPYYQSPPQASQRFGGANLYSPREPILFCDIILDHCDNQFGSSTAPSTCQATGGDDSACFNTKYTCVDTSNYRTSFRGKKIHRFAQEVGVGLRGVDFDAPQCIISANQAPVEIIPTKGVAVRASVTIKMRDFTSNDKGIDPYYSARNYIATDKSTYFSKMLARNPHYVGRTIRIFYGYVDRNGLIQSYDGLKEYVIESFALDKDIVTIKAKDILTLGDALKSKVPVPTIYTLKTDLPIGHGTNHFQVQVGGVDATAQQLIDGFGANNSTGYLRINEEIIKYTVDSDGSTHGGSPHLEITNNGRAQWGTIEEDHEGYDSGDDEDGDSVQPCVNYGEYTGDTEFETINTIAYDLLTNYANVPASSINNQIGGNNSWVDETGFWLSSYKMSFIISEPTAVNTLLKDIGSHAGVNFYYDDTFNQIVMRAETPQINENLIPSVTDTHIVKDSLKFIDSTKQRISRVYYYYDLKNHTSDKDKPKDFKRLQVNIDSDSELPDEYGQENTKTFFAYGVRDSSTASSMAGRVLDRFRLPPKTINFELDASFETKNVDGSIAVIYTGGHFDLLTKDIVNTIGDPLGLRMQCTSIQFDWKKQVYKVKATQTNSSTYNPAIIGTFKYAEQFYAETAILEGGSGYSTYQPNLVLTGGNGSGFTIDITTVSSGAITAFSVVDFGDGYITGDVLNDSGGFSIRLTSVSAKTSIASPPVSEPFAIV